MQNNNNYDYLNDQDYLSDKTTREKNTRKFLIIGIIFVLAIILISFIYFYYDYQSKKQSSINADIENVFLSNDGTQIFIRIKSQIKNIISVKFILSINDKEYSRESTEGISKLDEGYDYVLYSRDFGLNDFFNLKEISVILKYRTSGGKIVEIPKLDTQNFSVNHGFNKTISPSSNKSNSSVPSRLCKDDLGCLNEGIFCQGNNPFKCTLGNDECYNRINLTACLGNKVCINSRGCVQLTNCSSDFDCIILNDICAIGKCNSTNNQCYVSYNSSTDICRPLTGECDIEEKCTGDSASCMRDLFNSSGTTCSRGVCDGNGNCIGGTNSSFPIVSLLSPVNNAVLNSTLVNIACLASDNVSLKNISLFGDFSGLGELNQTKDLTGISNSTTFSLNLLSNSNYKWNCYACNILNNCNFSYLNYTFNISTNNFNNSRESLILNFSTYFGGDDFEQTRDVAVDSQGNIYFVGGTVSLNYPVDYNILNNSVPLDTGVQKMDVFVTKLRPDGKLFWSTKIGGPNHDRAYAVEVDSQGYVYVAGRAGKDFPVTENSFQTLFMGSPGDFYGRQDGFILKLSPDGKNLIWASYFGTTDSSIIRDIDIDQGGNVYLASSYQSGVYPGVIGNAFKLGYQKTPSGSQDGVVAKIKYDGTQVLWATFIGGTADEGGGPSIRVDSNGNVHYLTATQSTNILTTPGGDQTYNGGWDGYVAKISPSGANLLYGTYVGGSGSEGCETHHLALDSNGNLFGSFLTTSTDFPIIGGYQQNYGGGGDAVIVKLSPRGIWLASTYLGGSAADSSEGISVDSQGNVYVTGSTSSNNFVTSSEAFQKVYGGGADDGYLVKLSSNLDNLIYSTFLGGNNQDSLRANVLDSNDNFLVGGYTTSTNFPIFNAIQINSRGGNDNVFAKFNINSFVSQQTINIDSHDGIASYNPLTVLINWFRKLIGFY